MRRGLKNESITAKDILQGDLVDELVNKDQAYKFLKSVVGSPAYSEDKKKFMIAFMVQRPQFNAFYTFSVSINDDPYSLKQLYEGQYNRTISLHDVLELTPDDKAYIIRNNPVTSARYIHRYFKAILDWLGKKTHSPFKEYYVVDSVQKSEVQQKGVLYFYIVAQLNNPPEYNPDDNMSEKKYIKFIDQFITCRLNKDNPYVMEYQQHKHTFTCYKGMKNVKACRFHYPLWPMPETKILTKLLPEERNEQVKLNLGKVKNFLYELSKTP